jgi:hypothetical protein
VIFKSDKLDYLGGPRKGFFFDNFFSIGQGPSNVELELARFFFIHIQFRTMWYISTFYKIRYILEELYVAVM